MVLIPLMVYSVIANSANPRSLLIYESLHYTTLCNSFRWYQTQRMLDTTFGVSLGCVRPSWSNASYCPQVRTIIRQFSSIFGVASFRVPHSRPRKGTDSLDWGYILRMTTPRQDGWTFHDKVCDPQIRGSWLRNRSHILGPVAFNQSDKVTHQYHRVRDLFISHPASHLSLMAPVHWQDTTLLGRFYRPCSLIYFCPGNILNMSHLFSLLRHGTGTYFSTFLPVIYTLKNLPSVKKQPCFNSELKNRLNFMTFRSHHISTPDISRGPIYLSPYLSFVPYDTFKTQPSSTQTPTTLKIRLTFLAVRYLLSHLHFNLRKIQGINGCLIQTCPQIIL